MTFKQLQDRVLAYLDEEGDDNTHLTNVKNSLNGANVRRCGEYDWRFLIEDGTPFVTVAGQQDYALPADFGRPYYFFDRRREEFLRELPPRGLNELVIQDAAEARSHESLLYTLRGNNTTLRLLYKPIGGSTIAFEYYRLPTTMVDDSDVADIPAPYDEVLVWDALIDMKAYNAELETMEFWHRNQQKAELGLYDAYGDWAPSQGGIAQYINANAR